MERSKDPGLALACGFGRWTSTPCDLEGAHCIITAIYRTPISIETLMKFFQACHFLDVSGDTPSLEKMNQDLSQTDVVVPPAPSGPKSDSWTVREENGVKTRVRQHYPPRLALFVCTRLTSCPVPMDELTGKRVNIVKPLNGGAEVRIEDAIEVQRSILDRWVGEAQMDMKDRRPTQVRRSVPKTGQKERSDKDPEDIRDEVREGMKNLQKMIQISTAQDLLPAEPQDVEVEGEAIPKTALNEALLERGADVLDGLPVSITGDSGANTCRAPGCELPGPRTRRQVHVLQL